MTRFKVLLTEDAARDFEEIYEFVAENDSLSAADHILENVENSFRRLSEFPNRGSYPPELVSLGLTSSPA